MELSKFKIGACFVLVGADVALSAYTIPTIDLTGKICQEYEKRALVKGCDDAVKNTEIFKNKYCEVESDSAPKQHEWTTKDIIDIRPVRVPLDQILDPSQIERLKVLLTPDLDEYTIGTGYYEPIELI